MTSARDMARNMLARGPAASAPPLPAPRAASRDWSLATHPGVVAAMASKEMLDAGLGAAGLPNPYYVPHHGINGAVISILDQEMINFSGYNYLGLAGDPRVQDAAKAAIDQYGTSCSASRVVSGQIPLHAELESRIAAAYGTDGAVVTGSGYLTNAAVIGYVLGPKDLAVCDALVHNSIVAGTQWAQCKRMNFRHNDPEALDALLTRSRGHVERAMVIIEGVYSMDGDIAALPELVAVARKHDCLIMVDEAHSFGVLGETGFGVGQHHGVAGTDVDIWMGTLSKSLASYGGFLAASGEFVEALRMMVPGISLYAAAPAPATMGAAVAAFDIMVAEPERLERLRANGQAVADSLRAVGVDVGLSAGTPVVPALIGETRRTMVAAQVLLANGINANPIMYPAVAEGEGRIRFFVTAEHTAEQIERTAQAMGGFLAS